ncbi:hypothetical protein HELRODRAFT_179480 [Helobdella robusta]|uniref:Uncharacterized protein n=1 Tax=Helobdella robusta TaxID=6412 RepID=T1FES0_HELRO|nr:hypothetical protein HELRODRAFT_179480 [Helobdella robusta]ESN95406.1 hypothetical protein HELRODRAFT_179480 [Helobdella robusta]
MAQVCMLARMLWSGEQSGRMSYELVLYAGDRYGSDRSEIPNSKFLGDRHDRSRNETFPTFLGDRVGSTENILDFKYQFSFKSAEFAPEQVLPVYKPTPAQRLSVIRKRNNVSNSRNKCRMVQEDEEVEHSPLFDNHGESLHCQPSVNTKHHRLVRHHELLKPDKFDSTGCLKTFLKKFEICAMYNQWSMDDMEAYLSCSLTGEAAEVFWDLAGLGYQELVTKLENRYGTSGHEESYRHELQTLRRKPGESLRELSQTVKKLMSLAYPGEQSKLAEHLTRNFFYLLLMTLI